MWKHIAFEVKHFIQIIFLISYLLDLQFLLIKKIKSKKEMDFEKLKKLIKLPKQNIKS